MELTKVRKEYVKRKIMENTGKYSPAEICPMLNHQPEKQEN